MDASPPNFDGLDLEGRDPRLQVLPTDSMPAVKVPVYDPVVSGPTVTKAYFEKPGSYGWTGWDEHPRKWHRDRPLYVHKAQSFGEGKFGIYVGDTFVARGHRLAPSLIAALGERVVGEMFFVRELDHAPIEGLTPDGQLPDVAPAPRKRGR